MYCPYCGSKSIARAALFCSNCGRALQGDQASPTLISSAHAEPSHGAFWRGWPFWLFALAIVCFAASLAIPAALSKQPPGHPEVGLIIVMAVWFGYLWRRQRRSLAAGVLIGLSVGFTAAIISRASTASYVRFAQNREVSKTIPTGFVLVPEASDRFPGRWLEYPGERTAIHLADESLPGRGPKNGSVSVLEDPLGLDEKPVLLREPSSR